MIAEGGLHSLSLRVLGGLGNDCAARKEAREGRRDLAQESTTRAQFTLSRRIDRRNDTRSFQRKRTHIFLLQLR